MSTASLIVLTYNQQDLVEEALESAVAQDFPDLEVVVRDDASPDGTFERVRAFTERYTGPVRLIIDRAPANRGVLRNYYEAVGLSSGRYIVGAAGDDTARTDRVSRLVDCFERTGADCVFSSWERIDEAGRHLGWDRLQVQRELEFSDFFPGAGAVQVAGVTAAYRRSVFEGIHLPQERILMEDIFFTLMLNYRSRRIEVLDEPLVRYRVHDGALTNRVTPGADVEDLERGAMRAAQGLSTILQYFLDAVESGKGFDPGYGEERAVDLSRVRRALRFEELRSTWLDRSPPSRLIGLLRAPSPARIRWLVPRLLGLRSLTAAKRLKSLLSSPSGATHRR